MTLENLHFIFPAVQSISLSVPAATPQGGSVWNSIHRSFAFNSIWQTSKAVIESAIALESHTAGCSPFKWSPRWLISSLICSLTFKNNLVLSSVFECFVVCTTLLCPSLNLLLASFKKPSLDQFKCYCRIKAHRDAAQSRSPLCDILNQAENPQAFMERFTNSLWT